MPEPRVSVIVIRGELHSPMDETLRHVLRQTCQDFEVLIPTHDIEGVEPARSIDKSLEPAVRMLDVRAADMVTAKNLAIAAARGSYVCMLDSDTTLDGSYLAAAANALDEDPERGFVSCWVHILGDREETWKPTGCDVETLLGECVVAPCALFRKSAAVAVGGYDGGLGAAGYEDWDLWISLAEHGHRGLIIPEVLAHRRGTATGISIEAGAPGVHLRAMNWLVQRHGGSYARHLFDVLLTKERESSELLKLAYGLEWEIETRLAPAVQQRKSEIDRLRSKLRRVEEEQHLARALERLALETGELHRQSEHLNEHLRAAQREIVALRCSNSWRITAPLRVAAALLSRLTGSRSGTAG